MDSRPLYKINFSKLVKGDKFVLVRLLNQNKISQLRARYIHTLRIMRLRGNDEERRRRKKKGYLECISIMIHYALRVNTNVTLLYILLS